MTEFSRNSANQAARQIFEANPNSEEVVSQQSEIGDSAKQLLQSVIDRVHQQRIIEDYNRSQTVQTLFWIS